VEKKQKKQSKRIKTTKKSRLNRWEIIKGDGMISREYFGIIPTL
jgi:hypothetical protein